jgi:hypothetical protein
VSSCDSAALIVRHVHTSKHSAILIAACKLACTLPLQLRRHMKERAEELSMLERTTEGYSLEQKRDKLQSKTHVKVLSNGGSVAPAAIATIEQYFSSNPAEVAAAWRDAHDGVTVRKLPADDNRPGLAGTLFVYSY